MEIREAISRLTSTIGNRFGILIQRIVSIGNSILDVFGYILAILKAIWFGITSLCSGLWNLIVEILDGGFLVNVGRAFNTISGYIGGPATVFISGMLMIVFVRIFIAFIFKMFRLNIDYHEDKSRSYNWSKQDSLEKYKGEPLF